MNVLFILGTYLPKPSPNGICVEKIAKEFISGGDKVTCLCNKKYYDEENHVHIDEVEIYRSTGNPLDEVMQKYRDKRKNVFNKLMYFLVNSIRRIFVMVSTPFWPYELTFRALRLRHMADKLQRENHFDVVVCVNTPYEALMTGYSLKKKYQDILYVPYFLDALSGGPADKVVSVKNDFQRKQRFETKYLSNADKIVFMESSRIYHEKNDTEKEWYKRVVYLDIPLLSMPETSRNVNGNRESLNVVFAGTLLRKERNPQYFLDVFVNADIAGLSITFIGKHDCEEIFEKYQRLYPKKIFVKGFVTHGEVVCEILAADVLLNIGNNNTNMVPSKIFEYMSYGKPIISTYSSDSDTCIPYLDKFPLSLLLNENDEIRTNIEKLEAFIIKNAGRQVPFIEIAKNYYTNTATAFIKMMRCEK